MPPQKKHGPGVVFSVRLVFELLNFGSSRNPDKADQCGAEQPEGGWHQRG